MNRIIKILMERDDLTEIEATKVFENAKSELIDAISGTSILEPEEVMYEELGLEMDYIFDIL